MNLFEKYNIDIEKILKKLIDENGNPFYKKGDFYKASNTQFQVKCPFHNDKSPSLGINTELNAYHCFACREREEKINGNNYKIGKGTFLIHFINLFFLKILNKNLSDTELIELLEISKEKKDNFLKELKEKKDNFKVSKEFNNNFQKEETLNKLEIDILTKYKDNENLYFYERINKFNDFTIEEINKAIDFYNLGWDKEKEILTIPIFQNWYLIGIYGRYKIPFNNFRYLSLEKFPKSKVVFNLDEVENFNEVILVEGPLNAIKLWMLGYKNVISLFGAGIYKNQIEQIKKFEKITVWFDKDESGTNGIKEIKNKMKGSKIIELQTEKDALELSKVEINNLLGNLC